MGMFGWGLGLRGPSTVLAINVPGLPIWTASLTALSVGTSNARLLMLGDSLTAGYGANGANMINNDKAYSYPTQLAQSIQSSGRFKASWQNWAGGQNAESYYDLFDNRWTIPHNASFYYSSTFGTLGYTTGCSFIVAEAVTAMTFHPLSNCDTFEIYYAKTNDNAAAGWQFSVNGGAKDANVSTYDAVGAYGKYTMTRSLADNTLYMNTVNTTATFIGGIVAYSSVQKEISVINAGWSSGTVANVTDTSQPWGPYNSLPYYDPDLTVIMLGTNDAITGVSQATYKANLTTLINRLKAIGSDIVVLTPPPAGSTYTASVDSACDWALSVATTTSVPSIDLRPIFTSYTAATTAGLTINDGLHYNAAGYALIAAAVKARIMP